MAGFGKALQSVLHQCTEISALQVSCREISLGRIDHQMNVLDAIHGTVAWKWRMLASASQVENDDYVVGHSVQDFFVDRPGNKESCWKFDRKTGWLRALRSLRKNFSFVIKLKTWDWWQA